MSKNGWPDVWKPIHQSKKTKHSSAGFEREKYKIDAQFCANSSYN
jgi:hypothetical protein